MESFRDCGFTTLRKSNNTRKQFSNRSKNNLTNSSHEGCLNQEIKEERK